MRNSLGPTLNSRRGTAPEFSISRYNSATDCSILLKFGKEFENVTADITGVQGQRAKKQVTC